MSVKFVRLVGRFSDPRKGITLFTPSDVQDTEKSVSKDTAENRFYPSQIIWQQAFRHVEIPEGLRELEARAGRIISVTIFLQQLKCLRLWIYCALIKPTISIYFTPRHLITSM